MENYFQVTQIKKSKIKKTDTPNLFWSQDVNFHQVSDFTINKSIAERLENMVFTPLSQKKSNNLDDDNKEDNQQLEITNNPNKIMNMFLQGPRGTGKYSLAKFCAELYTGIKNTCLNVETIKSDSKEIDYYRGSKHCELILYKYNFNDTNLIQSFFETVCHKSEDYRSDQQKIIIIKNAQHIRRENLYLFKYYLEKFCTGNAFIFTSCEGIPYEFRGYMPIIRVGRPLDTELIELGKTILKSKKIKGKSSDIKKVVKQSQRNMHNFINLLQLSFQTGKFNIVEETDISKLLFLYKLIRKKNIKSVILIRELLVELLTENIQSQKILRYLLDRFINSKNVSHLQKEKIVSIITQTDINDKRSLKNVVHLEYCCLQIMNLFE